MLLAHHVFLVLARKRKRWHVQVQLLEMSIMHSLRCRHYITRQDRLPVRASPWQHLCSSQQDMGALQLMGLTWSAFTQLLDIFAPILAAEWNQHPRAD